jgi:hypothetical protein
VGASGQEGVHTGPTRIAPGGRHRRSGRAVQGRPRAVHPVGGQTDIHVDGWHDGLVVRNADGHVKKKSYKSHGRCSHIELQDTITLHQAKRKYKRKPFSFIRLRSNSFKKKKSPVEGFSTASSVSTVILSCPPLAFPSGFRFCGLQVRFWGGPRPVFGCLCCFFEALPLRAPLRLVGFPCLRVFSDPLKERDGPFWEPPPLSSVLGMAKAFSGRSLQWA